MATTVWKGQLTFGLVSFSVRLVRAARKDRIPLRYVQAVTPDSPEETVESLPPSRARYVSEFEEGYGGDISNIPTDAVVAPVRQAYIVDREDKEDKIVAPRQLRRGYEVAPGQFAVMRSEEVQRLRQHTSSAMEILRSVRVEEIDPVFLETSYYVLPGEGAGHSYNVLYRALKESGYAAPAEVAMHGRQHVIVIRPGAKGLLAHTMYYVNEVRAADEHVAEVKDVAAKELDLARRFVEAIAAPFNPEEFADRYREQLESLIASKKIVAARGSTQSTVPASLGNVVNIVEALRKSLENVKSEKRLRKPVTRAIVTAVSGVRDRCVSSVGLP